MQSVDVRLQQDLTALKGRKGDTGEGFHMCTSVN